MIKAEAFTTEKRWRDWTTNALLTPIGGMNGHKWATDADQCPELPPHAIDT